MCTILITGATGNVGFEVIRSLSNMRTSSKVVAGVRNIAKAKVALNGFPELHFVEFDFEKPHTFDKALADIDRIFLLRPPHISNVELYFRPLIASIKKNNVSEIIFLSVQGAEKSKVIPHNKIERLIMEYGLSYIFIRPGYFMQNLTTTLMNDIQTKNAILLPAGEAKFNWIDVENIGEIGAVLLEKFEEYKNQAFDITGLENRSFSEVSQLMNKVLEQPIRYRNINPLKFYAMKKKEGMGKGLILVMILLHFLPRFQKEPRISNFYEQVTGKVPTDLMTFIKREKDKWENKALIE